MTAQPRPAPRAACAEPKLLPGSELDREATDLLRRFCHNEEAELFRQLFQRTAPRLLPLLRLCIRQQRSAADPGEVLTDTFAQIYRARSSFDRREEGSFVRWFLAIARNQIRQQLRESRRRDRREQKAARSIQDSSTNPYQRLVREETSSQARDACLKLRALVLEGMRELPAACQKALLLHAVHGWKYREIAATLGISQSAVAMRMKRARERILRHVVVRLPEAAALAPRAGDPP